MTDYTIESFLQEQDQEREQRRLAKEQQTPEPGFTVDEDSALLDVDDLLLFAPRAAEGFVRSVGSLLPGLDFDDNRWFGRSDTFVGGALETISQFGLAMIPGGGIASGIAGLAKAGMSASMLAKAGKLSQLVGGMKGGRFVMAAGEGLGKGAIADFLAFDGHEQNLSAVLNAVPQLGEVIPDFLANDGEGGEYEGRLKNTLEGLGLGAAFNVVMEGLKGIKMGRKTVAETGETLDPKKTQEVLTSSVDPGRMGEGIGEIASARYGPSEDALRQIEAEDAAEAAAKEAGDTVPEGIAAERDVPITLRRVVDSEGVTREIDIAEPLIPGHPASEAISAQPGGREAIIRELVQNTEGGDELYRAAVERRAMGDLAENPRKLSFEEQLEQLVTSKHSNLKTILSDKNKGIGWLIRVFEDLGSVDPLDGSSPESRAAAVEAYIRSFDAGLPPREWIEQQIKRTAKGTATISDLMIHGAAFTKSLNAVTQGVSDEFLKMVEGGITPEGIQNVLRLGEAIPDAHRELRGLRGVLGEALESTKRWAEDTDASIRFGRMLMDNVAQGDETLLQFAKDWDYAAKGGKSVNQFVQQRELAELTIGRQVFNMTTEVFINNILGGFKTLVIQPLSGAILSVALPVEQMIGGAIMRDNQIVKQAFNEMASYWTAFSESALWARKALKKGDTIIGGRGLTENTTRRAIQGGALGTKPGSAMGNMLDVLGEAINLPSRLITGADEFTKQMRARGVVRAELLTEAATTPVAVFEQGEDGLTLVNRTRTQAEIDEFVSQGMKDLIVDGQMSAEVTAKKRAFREAEMMGVKGEDAVAKHVEDNWHKHFKNSDGNLIARAEQSMKEVTLQTDLDYQTWEGKWDIALRSHPIFQFVVPFYKTPLNSIKFGAQRMDFPHVAQHLIARKFPNAFPHIGKTQNRMIQDLMAGGAREASAIGRLTAGLSFMGIGAGLASQGILTGRGPSNPDERRTLLDAGWQPYSIKVGDKYVSYARLEPFSQFFGFLADFTDASRMLGEDDGEEKLDIGMAFLVALSNNVTQKSFLSGIGAFTAALGDPENKMEAFVAQYAGAAVPSNLAQMVTVFGDNDMKDTHGWLERIISRTPGLSESATPRRNMLGEVMDRSKAVGEDALGSFYGMFVPIAYREVGSDLIRNELADLKHGFSAPRPTVQGLDLRAFSNPKGQHAHDRWQELHGVVKVGGKSFRQALTNLIRSPKYRNLPKDLTSTEESPRVGLIRSMLGRYRAKAFEQLLDEYPELARALQEREEARARAKRGLAAL